MAESICALAARCDDDYGRIYSDDAACARDTRAFLLDFGYDGAPYASALDAPAIACLDRIRASTCEDWQDTTAVDVALSPDCRRPSAARTALDESLGAVEPTTFDYVGPGSMGHFSDYHPHPNHPDVLVAGGDLGGVYLSSDGGASWTNISLNLPTSGVWAVELAVFDAGTSAERTRILLGTDSGLFHSNDVASATGLTARAVTGWTEAGGVAVGEERPGDATSRALYPYNKTYLTLPIGALTVDPSNPQIVWAGITGAGGPNLAQAAAFGSGVQRFDRWKVYRSLDGGQTWEPVLRFSAPVPAFAQTPWDDDGSVFSILVNPQKSNSVFVASDRGLYGTTNATTTADANGDGLADLSWTELGTPTRRTSTNAGTSWSSATAVCKTPEANPKGSSWCLPVIGSAAVAYKLDASTGAMGSGVETHPNLRGLAFSRSGSKTRIYATIWDRGHAADKGSGCSTSVSGDTFHDGALSYFRGGLYVSEDGGETWKWLLTSTGAPGGTPYLTELHYRCDAQTAESSNAQAITYFPSLSTPTTYKSGLAALVGAVGGESGLYAYTAGASMPWSYLTDIHATGFTGRFEGSAPQAITIAKGVDATRLIADWSRTTSGYPKVWFGQRGALLGTWSSSVGAYQYAHLGSDYVGQSSEGLSLWAGTGLDNAVIWDVLDLDGTLWLGVSDGGVFKGEEVGDRVYYVAESQALWTPRWSTDPADLRDDEARALAWDAGRGVLYAGSWVTGSGTQYTMMAEQGGQWQVIGGYGYTATYAERGVVDSAHYNGFWSGSASVRLETEDLLVISEGTGPGDALLAATSDGLFAYDPERAAGAQWQEICASQVSGKLVKGLVMDEAIVPGWAFAAAQGVQLNGLLAIRLSDLSCQALSLEEYLDPATGAKKQGIDPVRYPAAVALATDEHGTPRIVVGALFQAYPAIFSAPISCDASACALSTWSWPMTGSGVFPSGSTRDMTMRRSDLEALATDPLRKSVVWAGLHADPAYDYYNPRYLYASQDGGQSFQTFDLESTDVGLPGRGVDVMRFSEDGAWLYIGSRSSLFRMPVGW